MSSLDLTAKDASLVQRAFERLGEHYIAVMMLVTRVFGSVGGSLVIYYVNLTTLLPPQMRRHFDVAAAIMVTVSVAMTVPLALWETRVLRAVLRQFQRGEPVAADRARQAGREAVLFPSRHHFHEAVLVPFCSVVPMCIYLRWQFDAPLHVLVQVTITGFLAIASVLLVTFFASERWMVPVTLHLLERGLAIPFDQMPASKLRARLNVSFSLIIVITALMIGALANQRASDIIANPERQTEAVISLRQHTVYITVAAMIMGILLSWMLASSIASRVGLMVEAMKRVQRGEFSQRVQPTGRDEIDILARQFNAMVGQLAENDQTIRDLNTNLEFKVKRRTRQLSKSRQSLKRSLEKLREYDRLKTEFFSNISHELRTPLTMILTPVERILEKHAAALPLHVASMLDIVRTNGQRLLELINRLLDFSKLEAGRMRLDLEGVDVNALVRELVSAATPLAQERGVRLDADCDPQVSLFAADRDKLDIIISNLLSNAIKFTPSGGQVRLETLRADDRVWLAVTDTGIGIAEQDYSRIFERFVQVDGSSSREFSGTGLGLALAKELIELHGGQVYVKSQLGQGSRFWFDLPLVPVAGDAPAPIEASPRRRARRFVDLEPCDMASPQPAPLEPAMSCGTVLVVDDSADVRLMLGEILRDDYRVLFARDGAEGMETALRERPDLIVSDVMMPRVDGQEFCRRVKADPATAQIAFVMLTARAELAMKIHGLDCGADDYLIKPFEEKELKARVRSLLKLRRLHYDLDKRNRDLETAYRQLSSMQGQLIHAEKMSSLGQLVAGLAHEINNSINAVYNGIQPLSSSTRRLESVLVPVLSGESLGCTASTRDEVEGLFRKVFSLAHVIENGASRTARIIGDLKTFSHPGSEEYGEFDLHGALDMCLNLLFNQIKHRITIRKEYGLTQRVHGPYGQLNQVFMNVLNNAQQAIPESGEIVVATRQQGDLVSVSIRDTGSGIPAEIMDRVFDPFFTTKGPGLGTGLGLSISYGIISRLGGTITCQSTPGRGSDFVVTFPRVSLGGADEREPPASTFDIPGQQHDTRHPVCG
ncbi:MAG: ATP-binding protein [Pirellulales bacterium]